MKKLLKISLLATSLLASSAFAQTATTPLQASATLNGSCTISASNLDLGVFSVAGQQTFGSAIQVLCNKGTAFHVVLSDPDPSAPQYNRIMSGATSGNTTKLPYQLWFDRADFYQNLDTNNKELFHTGTGINQVYKLNTYLGNVKYITPDTYSENITVTLNY